MTGNTPCIAGGDGTGVTIETSEWIPDDIKQIALVAPAHIATANTDDKGPRYDSSDASKGEGHSTTDITEPSTTDERPRGEASPLKQLHEQLEKERDASKPWRQFLGQVLTEEAMLRCQQGKHNDSGSLNVSRAAVEAVYKRWQEQGIWHQDWDEVFTPGPGNDEATWFSKVMTQWSHEKRVPGAQGHTEPNVPEQHQTFRMRESSRPIHQFLHQLAKAIEPLPDAGVDAAEDPVQSLGIAYSAVRRRWVRQGIWSRSWVHFPGLYWKHELPLDRNNQPVMPAWFQVRPGLIDPEPYIGEPTMTTSDRHRVSVPIDVQPRRKRGRPRKPQQPISESVKPIENEAPAPPFKRGRGRPRKQAVPSPITTTTGTRYDKGRRVSARLAARGPNIKDSGAIAKPVVTRGRGRPRKHSA